MKTPFPLQKQQQQQNNNNNNKKEEEVEGRTAEKN